MHLQLRPWDIKDLDNLVKYSNNLNVVKQLKDIFPYPYTEKYGRDFIEMTTKYKPTRIYAIDADGQAIGAIGITPKNDVYRKNAELGYWLGEPFWGKGIITKALSMMLEIAFRDFDVDRVYASTFGSNIVSQKVLEKNHFKRDAVIEKCLFKNGDYHDEVIYSIRSPAWNK